MKKDYFYGIYVAAEKMPRTYAVIRVPENEVLATFESFTDAQHWLNLIKPAGTCRIFEQVL